MPVCGNLPETGTSAARLAGVPWYSEAELGLTPATVARFEAGLIRLGAHLIDL